jgi:hypothetical protein
VTEAGDFERRINPVARGESPIFHQGFSVATEVLCQAILGPAFSVAIQKYELLARIVLALEISQQAYQAWIESDDPRPRVCLQIDGLVFLLDDRCLIQTKHGPSQLTGLAGARATVPQEIEDAAQLLAAPSHEGDILRRLGIGPAPRPQSESLRPSVGILFDQWRVFVLSPLKASADFSEIPSLGRVAFPLRIGQEPVNQILSTALRQSSVRARLREANEITFNVGKSFRAVFIAGDTHQEMLKVANDQLSNGKRFLRNGRKGLKFRKNEALNRAVRVLHVASQTLMGKEALPPAGRYGTGRGYPQHHRLALGRQGNFRRVYEKLGTQNAKEQRKKPR